jgi:hypothetical protein
MGVLTVFYVGGCATLPKDFKRPVSYAYTDTNDTYFGKARSDEIRAHAGHLLAVTACCRKISIDSI